MNKKANRIHMISAKKSWKGMQMTFFSKGEYFMYRIEVMWEKK